MAGGIIHRATCVAIDGRAVLLEGPPGCGKSSLALQLIDRGAVLVGDDAVALEARGAQLIASPPPNIAGRIEIRNVGIATLPTCIAPVALRLLLDPDAPRHVERAETAELCAIPLPTLRFDPAIPGAAVRVEYALRLHGLTGHA